MVLEAPSPLLWIFQQAIRHDEPSRTSPDDDKVMTYCQSVFKE